MAGLGRRTHYRKHLTDSVLHDFPEPSEDERIGRIVATRGSNQFDVRLARHSESSCATTRQQDDPVEPQLAILPTKFRKLVWLKRNDYVIVQTTATTTTDEPSAENVDETSDDKNTMPATTSPGGGGGGGIRFMITHILYKDQIKHLQSKHLWPDHDPEFQDAAGGSGGATVEKTKQQQQQTELEQDDDGIIYDTGYEQDEDIYVNTNRIANLRVEDSSSDDDDDDDD